MRDLHLEAHLDSEMLKGSSREGRRMGGHTEGHLKRKKMEIVRIFRKRENDIKLGLVLEEDVQTRGPQAPVSMVLLPPALPITPSTSIRLLVNTFHLVQVRPI